MDCYYCDAEAVQECARCGALYCDDHGEALCQRCQDPALALPSYRVYRGSLVALLIGTVFAIWLLVRPPATTDADGPVSSLSGVLSGATPTATATPSPQLEGTAVATPVATTAAGATPTASATAEPTAPPGEIEHAVAPGETLYSIAETFAPAGTEVLAFIDEIAAYNGISDPSTITVGQVIKIPQ